MRHLSTDIRHTGLFPEIAQFSGCIILNMFSAHDHHLVNVNCSDTLLHDVLCEMADNYSSAVLLSWVNMIQYCSANAVRKDNNCFEFLWGTANHFKTDQLVKYFLPREKNISVSHFAHIFVAVASTTFPRIFDIDVVHYTSIVRYDDIFNYTKQPVTSYNEEAFFVITQEHVEHIIGQNLVQCKDGPLFSVSFFCESLKLCKQRKKLEDNAHFCLGSPTGHTNDGFVKKHQRNKCSTLVFISHTGECFPYYFTAKQHIRAKKSYFKCQDRSDIDLRLVNDFVADCSTETDELMMKSIYQNHSHFAGHSQYQIPCLDGHAKCFNVTDICAFKINEYNMLEPCRTGEHLQQCKEFECNMMFKCPEYYCIPWGYVCDRKWDCPMGMDEPKELCSQKQNCSHLFKCKSSGICLPVGDVCDNEYDCQFGDDENLCSLHKRPCVISCICLTHVINCIKFPFNSSQLLDIFTFEIVKLSYSCAPSDELSYTLTHTAFVQVHHINFMMSCSMLKTTSKLICLELNSNNVTKIQNKCLPHNNTLKVLQVVNNKLSFVDKSFHTCLQRLLFLNISGNPITCCSTTSFAQFASVKFLSILNISDTNLHGNQQELQPLTFLETFDYHFCCFVKNNSVCSANVPWYFSCGSLCKTSATRVTLLVLTVCMSVFDTINLVLQFFCYRKKVDKSFCNGTTVTVISLCDICILLVFTFLLGTDKYYGSTFGWNERHWKRSKLCHSVYVFFLVFHLFSPTMYSFFAFSRLMVVVHPIVSNFKETNKVQKYISCLFIVCAVVSSIFATAMFLLNPTLPSPICSPFIDPTDRILTTKVATWFVAIFLFLNTVFVIINYICLICSVKKSQRTVQSRASKRISNRYLYIQLIFTTGSNTICWIPNVVLYILFMFLERYPASSLSWTPVLISTNSLIMPVVQIVGAARKLHEANTCHLPLHSN